MSGIDPSAKKSPRPSNSGSDVNQTQATEKTTPLEGAKVQSGSDIKSANVEKPRLMSNPTNTEGPRLGKGTAVSPSINGSSTIVTNFKIGPTLNPGDTSRVRDKIGKEALNDEDGETFSDQRRVMLTRMADKVFKGSKEDDGNLISEIDHYGRLTSSPENGTSNKMERIGLRLTNNLSTPYLRDKKTEAVEDVYGKLYDKVRKDYGKSSEVSFGEDYVFVNSKEAKDKLEVMSKKGGFLSKIKIKSCFEIEPGLCILCFDKGKGKIDDGDSKKQPSEVFKKEIIPLFGLTPSIRQATKYLSKNSALELPDIEEINNNNSMKAIKESENIQKLNSVDNDSPLKPMANMVLNIVTGLPDINRNKNPLINEALSGIKVMVDYLATCVQSPQEFARGVGILIEEIDMLLTVDKPYTDEDFDNASAELNRVRLPSMAGCKMSTKMRASGMDALSSAIYYANKFHNSSEEAPQSFYNVNYFEVNMLLEKMANPDIDSPIIISCLNSSTPIEERDDDKLISEVKKKCKSQESVTLILDSTIQKNINDLDDLLSKMKDEISEGKLNIILCQSYQKYPSLGTGKVKAGAITIINNGTDKWTELEDIVDVGSKSLAKMEKPESQLMTHFLKTAADSEFELIKHASKNSEFMHKYCANTLGEGSIYINGLPFVLLADKSDMLLNYLKFNKIVERRDSFGFLQSSFLEAQDYKDNYYVRINLGNESEADILQQFFAVGHLYGEFGDNISDCDEQGPDIMKQTEAFLEVTEDIDCSKRHLAKILNIIPTEGFSLPIEKIKHCINSDENLKPNEKKDLVQFAEHFSAFYKGSDSNKAKEYLDFIHINRHNIVVSYAKLALEVIGYRTVVEDYLLLKNVVMEAISGIRDGKATEIERTIIKEWSKGILDSDQDDEYVDNKEINLFYKKVGEMPVEYRLEIFRDILNDDSLKKFGNKVKNNVIKLLFNGAEGIDVLNVIKHKQKRDKNCNDVLIMALDILKSKAKPQAESDKNWSASQPEKFIYDYTDGLIGFMQNQSVQQGSPNSSKTETVIDLSNEIHALEKALKG
ncbi:hypothetical protein [Marinibactrum halimedae]|uniref:Uncharacterized protein n=1 Tax=Marinibactrum halimedae TaxID=1444977 RepID=A0AA37WN07_9GAMM|nr:hypothetical protein [Marinibactrum halimedae]MCD9459031.1 hypothetical protein [Marinibactrum halimedae]GLS26840.1 hypothetical protein GCM10007877_25590 [Marinibactrum halimedae]